MFMLKSTHESLLQTAVEAAVKAETKRLENKYGAEIYDLQVQKGELHRQLDTAGKTIKDRDETIAEMLPIFELGARRKASNRKHAENKKAARRAAKEAK